MPRAPSSTTLLARLHAIRSSYTPEVSAEKLALLLSLESRSIHALKALAAYHGDLLFLRAFPDDAFVHARAGEALAHFAPRVRKLPASRRETLDDSGITGTSSRHTFAFGIAEWLVRRGERADIDWPNYEQPERLDPLLRQTLVLAEADAFDSGELTTREWLRLARSPNAPNDLAWLLAPRPRRLGLRGREPPRVARAMYEAAEVPVVWDLAGSTAATRNEISGITPVARSAMRRLPPSAPALIARPMRLIEDPLALGAPFPPGAIARLAPARVRIWIDVARAALATICREVHAITYANDDEVYVADLGQGTAVCVIGVIPEERLTLETNYGHVLFANGVPIGYGGVTPLAAQANTGVNVFAAFRQSEAACLFAHALRAFRTLFRVTRFVVNPYQFGAGNAEALASGAYWFYDRLGFRPVDASVRATADRERERLTADRKNRSDRQTLRALASGDVVLELPGARSTALFDERWLV